MFNIHLDDSPYQPYQLLNIEYGDAPFLKTEDEAVAAAIATRGKALDLLEADMKAAGRGRADAGVRRLQRAERISTGPRLPRRPRARTRSRWRSRRPSGSRAGALSTCSAPRSPIRWPSPAFTWTPTTADDDAEDHHDRIDFTFGRAAALKVLEAGIVGEKTPEADIVVTPWPSDHRSSYARLAF